MSRRRFYPTVENTRTISMTMLGAELRCVSIRCDVEKGEKERYPEWSEPGIEIKWRGERLTAELWDQFKAIGDELFAEYARRFGGGT